jgi:hypothetical protein
MMRCKSVIGSSSWSSCATDRLSSLVSLKKLGARSAEAASFVNLDVQNLAIASLPIDILKQASKRGASI